VELIKSFIIYVTLFRLAIISAGIVSIILGYKLFCRGVWPDINSSKETSLNAEIAGSRFTLKNAAPGTFFALFGVLIIAIMFATGGPELTLNSLKKSSEGGFIRASDFGSEERGETVTTKEFSAKVRGQGTDMLSIAISKGKEFEQREEFDQAIAAYKEALLIMATPMNQLAWLYYKEGKNQEALSLSQMAVQLVPGDADFLDTLAEILFQEEKYGEALQAMEKAVNLDSSYRSKLGKFRQAIK